MAADYSPLPGQCTQGSLGCVFLRCRTTSPLNSNHLHATVSSHPQGNIPQVTVPSPRSYYANDPRHETKHADTRAYEPQNETETAYWDTYSAFLRDRFCVPLSLAGVFDSEELHMLNRGHRNGFSSCRLGCRLSCHLGSRFGCTLDSGFGTRFGSFGSRLGRGLGRGHQPLLQGVGLGNIAREVQFSIGKKILLPSAVHLKERLKVSQSVS